MKKLLVLSRQTRQTEAFKKAASEYVIKNNVDIQWGFSGENQYIQLLEMESYDCVLVSPELMVELNKIKLECESINMKCLELNAADFGLRRVENIIKAVNKVL